MTLWINHVAIAAPRNGTNSHTVDPSSGTVIAGSNFAATAGSLLVCVVHGSVTSSTPSGWTLPTSGSAINATGLYVWHRSAAGGDTITTTHNNSNFPIVAEFFEFASGSTFVKSASATSVASAGAGPSATSLTGTHLDMFAMGRSRGIGEVGAVTATWGAGTELIETSTDYSSTPGYHYSLAYAEDATGSSASSAVTFSGSGSNAERLTFVVTAVAGGASNFSPPFRRNPTRGLIMRGRR